MRPRSWKPRFPRSDGRTKSASLPRSACRRRPRPPDRIMAEARMRLDQLLVERGLFQSRARARAAILGNLVHVDGKPAVKASQAVDMHAEIEVDPHAHLYVSRGALKLAHALDSFAIDPAGLYCLDIGA